MALQSFKD